MNTFRYRQDTPGGEPPQAPLKEGDYSWNLPGQGEPYIDCGALGLRGCTSTYKHPEGLDGRPRGAVFVQIYRRNCLRASCPVCFKGWAHKEANKVNWRLRHFKPAKFRRPIHVTISPPLEAYNKGVPSLRREAYKLLKKAGVVGGCLIYHPFRARGEGWYLSPHFHIIGFGWILGAGDIARATGWIIKNLGVRRSIRATISYQLSHCGIKKGRHSIVWFGALAYNKLFVPELPEDPPRCPICGDPLEPLPIKIISGWDPPPPQGDYFYTSTLGLRPYNPGIPQPVTI